MQRNLLFETSWLDKADAYFLLGERLAGSHHTGDSLLFSQRPVNHRFFVPGHAFGTGETTVLVRIASTDALVLPIFS